MQSTADTCCHMMTLVKAGLNKPSRNDEDCANRCPNEYARLIFLMPSWIVNESPMQLLCLLTVKLLSAIRALKCASHLDTNIRSRAVARLRCITDFHCLKHSAKQLRSTWRTNTTVAH